MKESIEEWLRPDRLDRGILKNIDSEGNPRDLLEYYCNEDDGKLSVAGFIKCDRGYYQVCFVCPCCGRKSYGPFTSFGRDKPQLPIFKDWPVKERLVPHKDPLILWG